MELVGMAMMKLGSASGLASGLACTTHPDNRRTAANNILRGSQQANIREWTELLIGSGLALIQKTVIVDNRCISQVMRVVVICEE